MEKAYSWNFDYDFNSLYIYDCKHCLITWNNVDRFQDLALTSCSSGTKYSPSLCACLRLYCANVAPYLVLLNKGIIIKKIGERNGSFTFEI